MTGRRANFRLVGSDDRPAADAERIPPLLVLAADYDIERELGRGGTAVVYLARERATNADVAIKLIHARYAEDAEAVARFAREARFIAQLDHPNVVRVHAVIDLGDGGVALVMAHVAGRTLKQLIQEEGPLSPPRAERVMRDIASALGAAHARGIVHRDVKPENIFIDDSGRALLADFGVARSMSAETQQLTMHGVAIGTPTYMAPEQIDGGSLDGRGDIYSLGLVGWEMLSGRRPWDGEALYSVLYHQKHVRLPAIDELRSDVPARLAAAIDGATEKERDARWQTVDELTAALDGNPPARRAPVIIPVGADTVHFARPPVVMPAFVPDAAPALAAAAPVIAPLSTRQPPSRRVVVAGALVSLLALILVASVMQAWSGGAARRRQLAQSVPAVAKPSVLPRGDSARVATPESALVPSVAAQSGVSEGVVLDSSAATAAATGVDRPLVVAMGMTPSGTVTGQVVAPAPVAPLAAAPPIRIGGARARIVTGGRHTCLLSADGRAYCWGGNDRGQLGTGGSGRVSSPTAIATAKRFTVVAPGLAHSCAIDADGAAWCWGENDHGQLGERTTTAHDTPTLVADVHRFRTIVAGAAHSCALDTNGAAWCWGANDAGQLGGADAKDRSAPVIVAAGRRFVSLDAGWNFTCALDARGQAFCWGDDRDGQLGDGGSLDRRSPVAVQGRLAFMSISAGNAHACGVTTGGDTYCWGTNGGGQLGDGSTTARTAPARVAGEARFASVTAGAVHSCALTAAGEAFCWGRNTYGQLGDGGTQDHATPVRVAGGHAFASIRAFGSHTCGATASGEAFCWGYNLDGQLGDGTRTHRTRPVYVEQAGGR